MVSYVLFGSVGQLRVRKESGWVWSGTIQLVGSTLANIKVINTSNVPNLSSVTGRSNN